jgi:hypothetical protein
MNNNMLALALQITWENTWQEKLNHANASEAVQASPALNAKASVV